MRAATRLLSLYVMLVGLAVAVHFIVVSWYHPGGDEPYPVWEVMDWFMAAAILVTLAGAFVHKRRHDAAGGGDNALREHVSVNTLFYAALAVGLLFFWNWVDLLRGKEQDFLVWNMIDTALPLLLLAGGVRLWRAASET